MKEKTHKLINISTHKQTAVPNLSEDETVFLVPIFLFPDTNDKVYAGGFFTAIDGNTSMNHIAVYDRTTNTWSALATGINGAVHTLTVAPNGEVYAGGSFTTAGSTAANNIAKWNGTTWEALGDGTNGTVLTIAIKDNDMLIGGDFTLAGGKTNNYLAHYTLVQPCPVITTNTTATDVSCNGGNDGKAKVTATNGTTPYTYNWSNGATTEDLTALTSGTYYVTVTDVNSCTATDSATITEPAAVVIPPALFEEWTASYTATDTFTETALATDKDGNVYVTGTTKNATGEHLVTLKYNPQGTLQWEAVRTENSIAKAISTDKDGNVYVAGNVEGTNDFIIAKYDNAGAEQWTSTYTTANTTAGLSAMVLDDKGDIYLTATSDAILWLENSDIQ